MLSISHPATRLNLQNSRRWNDLMGRRHTNRDDIFHRRNAIRSNTDLRHGSLSVVAKCPNRWKKGHSSSNRSLSRIINVCSNLLIKFSAKYICSIKPTSSGSWLRNENLSDSFAWSQAHCSWCILPSKSPLHHFQCCFRLIFQKLIPRWTFVN